MLTMNYNVLFLLALTASCIFASSAESLATNSPSQTMFSEHSIPTIAPSEEFDPATPDFQSADVPNGNLGKRGTCAEISPPTLPDAVLGDFYFQLLNPGNTFGIVFTYSVTSGALLSGLALLSNGTLSGTLTATGSNGFQVGASSEWGCAVVKDYTINVVCASDVSITPSQMDKAVAQQAYSNLVSTSRGQGFYDFTLAPGGQLPSGLSLSTSGWINGTTTETGDFTFNVTAQRHNATCLLSGEVSLHVCQSWDVLLSTFTNAVQDEDFEATISLVSSSGGSGLTNWTAELSGGELPDGLGLSENGTVSGVASDEGTFSFTVSITLGSGAGQDQGCVYTQSFTITIAASSSAPRLRHWLSW